MFDAIMQILNFLGDHALTYAMDLIRYVVRFSALVLFGIGLRYTLIKMFGLKLKENHTNIIISIFLLFGSVLITIIYHSAEVKLSQMIWETIFFWLVSNGGYFLLAKDLCKRVDDFLDNRFGQN